MCWQDRERARIASGQYKLPPWHAEPWASSVEHFPHVSRDNPELLAYTQNADKGERDLKTKIKPGVYLKKFFSAHLNAPTIAQWASRFRSLNDTTRLTIAETPEECADAYRQVGSCCSYSEKTTGTYSRTPDGPCHPALVFGSPADDHVTVAYIKRNETITARALLNRIARTYQSAYGDTETLHTKLTERGYTKQYSGVLTGLHIHAIPTDKRTADGRPRWVAPVIDGYTHARHDAARGTLVLLSPADNTMLPASERLTLGYFNGLTN